MDDLFEELPDRWPVYTFPDFQLVIENPIVAGDRKRKRKDHRKSQKKAPAPTPRPSQAVLQSRAPASPPGGPCNPFAGITCFFCSKKGHYANNCPLKQQKITRSQAKSLSAGRVQEAPDVVSGTLFANSHSAAVLSNSGATSRSFLPPVIRSHAPAKHPNWRVVYNPVNSISAEKAQEAPDVVLGTFPVNFCPDTVLFNSGASHSIVSPSFATMVMFTLLFVWYPGTAPIS